MTWTVKELENVPARHAERAKLIAFVALTELLALSSRVICLQIVLLILLCVTDPGTWKQRHLSRKIL